jgi:hypothetical protein
MQIKPTLRLYLTPVRMAIIKNTEEITQTMYAMWINELKKRTHGRKEKITGMN